jgi:hypothetical protein
MMSMSTSWSVIDAWSVEGTKQKCPALTMKEQHERECELQFIALAHYLNFEETEALGNNIIDGLLRCNE